MWSICFSPKTRRAPCRNCSVMPFRSPSRARKPSCGWSGGYPGGGLFRGGGHRQADECHQVPGKNRQGFCPVTLREAAAALARKEPLLLPALEVGEQGLAFAGFALYQEGGITQWLTGPEALGAALLLGDRVHWTGSVEAQAMVLQSTGCRVVPQMEEGRLTGLSIRCRLEGVLTGGWRAARGCGQTGGRDRPGHVPGGGGAPAGRGRRDGSAGPGGAVESVPVAGAVQPVAYAFSTLPVEVSVTITVTERQ